MRRRILTTIAPGLAIFFLILESRSAMRFAAQGIDLCMQTVIPSLFPFFLISIYLTGNVSGNGTVPVILSGLLGGYPVGAQAAAEAFRTGRITRATASRMLMFCSQAGPAFLFGMVAAQFPEQKYGWILWGIQLLSGVSVACLVHRPESLRNMRISNAAVSFSGAMKSAIRAMASVCGWVVIFRVILGFISFLPIPGIWHVLISGLLELSNGCICLDTVQNVALRFLLAAIMLNFGGICVLLQTASVVGTLDLRYYVFGKLVQTGFAILYTVVFFGYCSALLPVFFVLLLRFGSKSAKNSSIPAHIGV